MKPDKTKTVRWQWLNREIKLQINERLYQTGIISKDVYETAKSRIVSDGSGKQEEKRISGS